MGQSRNIYTTETGECCRSSLPTPLSGGLIRIYQLATAARWYKKAEAKSSWEAQRNLVSHKQGKGVGAAFCMIVQIHNEKVTGKVIKR